MAKKQGRPRKPGRPKGKSRRKSNTQDGGRLFDGSLIRGAVRGIRRGNQWLRDNKAISRTARALGYNTVGNVAAMAGYGVQNGGRSIGTAVYRPVLGRI